MGFSIAYHERVGLRMSYLELKEFTVFYLELMGFIRSNIEPIEFRKKLNRLNTDKGREAERRKK